MTFFNFLCQKLESVGLSKIVLDPFPDIDNFDYFLQKETTPRDTVTLHLNDCR